MTVCAGCRNMTCLNCANRWAFDRFLLTGAPDCCFCRYPTNVIDLHSLHLGEFLPSAEAEPIYSELAHIEDGLDLPFMEWEDYFQLFGWNAAREGTAANPIRFPDAGEPAIFVDLTDSDIEFMDLTQDTASSDDTDWTPRRHPSPSAANRRVRRRLLDGRRELRVNTR